MTTTKTDPTAGMTEAELADYYDRTHDLSGFEGGKVAELAPASQQRLTSSVAVRFSAEQIEDVQRAADRAGMKLTAFIRAAAVLYAEGNELQEARDLARQLNDNLNRLVGTKGR